MAMLHPDFALFDRYAPLVDDAPAFQDALRRPMPEDFWVHPLRTTPEALVKALQKDGIRVSPLPYYPGAFRTEGSRRGLGRHWTYFAGRLHIQEASSMMPVRVLNIAPGERVLDLCAAPGNKTAQAALAAANAGTVAANDISCGRLSPVRAVVNRLGLLNVCITCHDGISFPKSAGQFDAVLVDAPCSCEGTSRRYPGLLSRPKQHGDRPAKWQALLLNQAVRRCRTGGRILYATCTYAPEENEAVVDHVLREWDGRLTLLPASIPGFVTAPGLTRWQGRRFHADLEKTLRIWPHLNDTGGFYIALLQKTGGPPGNPVTPPVICDAAEGASGPSRPLPWKDADRFTMELEHRFGIPREAFSGLFFLVKSDRMAYAVDAGHSPPPLTGRSIGISVGMSIARISGGHFKLTTAGASAFGRRAVRNRIVLTPEQLPSYLARKPVFLLPLQIETCTDDGPVLIGYQDAVIGTGRYRRRDRSVESLFPKYLAVETV